MKRLLDAVNGGGLDVPAHIRKLELEVKEWGTNERKAKRAVSAAAKGPKDKDGAAKGRMTMMV